jgi:uncharacterized protein YcfJ
MGMNDRLSSTRAIGAGGRFDDDRYAPVPPPPPAPVADYNYRRPGDDRLYEAHVISARAVVGPPEQRCWVEREHVPQDRSQANVPAALAGALIGGVLGHQIGNGRGQDLATVGGVVAGAAVGANVGRGDGGQEAYGRDVQRCEEVPGRGRPSYWEVLYRFRGQEHRAQMTAPPGPTLLVNERGEPRG